jgi:hypothetical protein
LLHAIDPKKITPDGLNTKVSFIKIGAGQNHYGAMDI